MIKSILKDRQDGFSLVELLVSLVVLVPLMSAVVSLFGVAMNQRATEQSSIEANLEARAGMEMITQEISQAGSHHDAATTTTSVISTPLTSAQPVAVASSAGFAVGDFVEVGVGASWERLQITDVTGNSISGVFRLAHPATGAPVRLFALPYAAGLIPPAGLGPSSSSTETTIRLFGDLNGDGTICYVEYVYDSQNSQITRSMTPITSATKNAAIPLISNIKANSAQFTFYTDSTGAVAAVNVAMVVRNPVRNGTQFEETSLSSRIVAPSVAAASGLLKELEVYGGINRLPPTPSQIVTWANQ